jgi:hypothetical protein
MYRSANGIFVRIVQASCLLAVLTQSVSAAVIGASTAAQGITTERIAELPESERNLWKTNRGTLSQLTLVFLPLSPAS